MLILIMGLVPLVVTMATHDANTFQVSAKHKTLLIQVKT
jgi:hypothetical protein